MEVAPDLHLVDGTRGANVYLIAEDTLTLVDCGLPGNGAAIVDYITRLGRRPRELARLVLTHGHQDHAGSAAEVKERTGANVLAHIAEMQDGALTPGLAGVAGRVFPRLAGLTRIYPVPVAAPLRDGDALPVLGGLMVLHMPGHSPGSICLFSQGRGVLFSGDALINNGGRLSRPTPWRRRNRLLAEQSLQKLLALDIRLCCFAHGSPLSHDIGARVLQLVRDPATTPLSWRIKKNVGLLALLAAGLLRRRT